MAPLSGSSLDLESASHSQTRRFSILRRDHHRDGFARPRLGAIQANSYCSVQQTTGRQTGADWEWCLYDEENQRYLRFLVQAKVLDNRDQTYAHIDRYIGNSGVRQIDRLQETSKRRGVPAIYAFYNHLNELNRVPFRKCECFKCHGCWGASVAPLGAVLAMLPDKSFDTLKTVSMPWVCLLCAQAEDDPIDRALRGLQKIDAYSRDILGDRMAGIPRPPERPDREPPDYFQPLREFLLAGSDVPIGEDMQEKLAARNPALDGVVLIDATSDRDEFSDETD